MANWIPAAALSAASCAAEIAQGLGSFAAHTRIRAGTTVPVSGHGSIVSPPALRRRPARVRRGPARERLQDGASLGSTAPAKPKHEPPPTHHSMRQWSNNNTGERAITASGESTPPVDASSPRRITKITAAPSTARAVCGLWTRRSGMVLQQVSASADLPQAVRGVPSGTMRPATSAAGHWYRASPRTRRRRYPIAVWPRMPMWRCPEGVGGSSCISVRSVTHSLTDLRMRRPTRRATGALPMAGSDRIVAGGPFQRSTT